MAKSTYTTAPALLKMDRIVAMLKEDDLIWTQVAEKLHIHRQTASRYLWHMVQETPRRIHICSWIEDEKTFRKIPVFAAGNKPNKRKPKRLTSEEVFARIQADPVRHAKRREKYRVEWHLRKGRPVPPRPVASPFAALGL
jgi:hypothetical protein